MPLREFRQLRHARHRTVLVHHLADHSGRIQPRDAREIHGCLGLAGANHDPAGAGTEREHVAGSREVRRRRRGIDRGKHGGGAVRGRDAGGGAALRLDRHTERCLEARGVLRDHQRDFELVEPLRRHRQADQSAAVARHEVDRVRRHFLGRDRQIAFVLPIRVVDDDDHLPRTDRGDGILDTSERGIVLLCDLELLHECLSQNHKDHKEHKEILSVLCELCGSEAGKGFVPMVIVGRCRERRTVPPRGPRTSPPYRIPRSPDREPACGSHWCDPSYRVRSAR